MTLIVGCANDKYAVLASDRRLTFPNGVVAEEESCKLTVFACNDAKLMFAYTGSARAGNTTTEDWLVRLFKAESELHISIYEILERIKVTANKEATAIERMGSRFQIEVLMIGFYYGDDQPQPKVWKLSNIEGNDGFQLHRYSKESGAILIESAGNTRAITKSDIDECRVLLSKRAPAAGAEMKAANCIKKAASRKSANGKIGQQVNTCRLSAGRDAAFIATYHSEHPKQVMYGVNSVFAVGGTKTATMGPRLIAGSECPPVSLPKVNPGKRCPCGSGMKYKHCHARMRYPYLPVTHQLEVAEKEVASGRIFTVMSYGAYG